MGPSRRGPNITIDGHELNLKSKMNLKRGFPTILAFLLILSPIFSAGLAEVMRTGAVSFSGIIENVHEDFRFIVVNEMKVFISPSTQIVDEYRNVLAARDLRRGALCHG